MLPFDGRRSSIHLIGEILRLLRLGQAGRTEIMYAVRLTHSQTQKYLTRLVTLRLIATVDEGGKTSGYRITSKGLDVLTEIDRVQEMLKVDELPEILESPELEIDRQQDRNLLDRVKDALRGRQQHQP